MKYRFTPKYLAPAFTLAEMLVSVSIIIIMTVLFVTNYHFTNSRTDLIMQAQEMVASIHLTQNNTLGLTQYNGMVPPGGWGLSFSTASSTYTLFADLNAPGNLGYMQYDPMTEGVVAYGARRITLPPGIIISNLGTDQASSVPAVNLTFLPPDPQVNIYNPATGATSTTLLITLKELNNNTIKTIRVNFLGLADVIN